MGAFFSSALSIKVFVAFSLPFFGFWFDYLPSDFDTEVSRLVFETAEVGLLGSALGLDSFFLAGLGSGDFEGVFS